MTLQPGQSLSAEDCNLLERGDVLLDSATRVCFFDRLIRSDYIWARIGTGSNTGAGASCFTFLGRPGADGFMPHDGGPGCFVPPFDVQSRRRDGSVCTAGPQSHYWIHDGDRMDIIAWRPAPSVEGGQLSGNTGELDQGALPEAAPLSVPTDDVSDSADQLRIVFDGPPGPDSPRFIEVENAAGQSVNAGEWRERADGYWELVIGDQSDDAKIGRDFLRAIEAVMPDYPWLASWSPAESYGELVTDLLDIAFPDLAALSASGPAGGGDVRLGPWRVFRNKSIIPAPNTEWAYIHDECMGDESPDWMSGYGATRDDCIQQIIETLEDRLP